MFIKLSVIFAVLRFAAGQDKILDWELAVAIGNHIELLQPNGSVIQSSTQPFNKLKALTYDNIRDQFIVSNTDRLNDTIFTVQLTEETDTDITPIIQDLPDDVLGLAIDPIDDVLYWTDAINSTINYVAMNETLYESKEFLSFKHEYPHAIVIDICKRYIYWTNQKSEYPSIERARLDGTGHETLVDRDVVTPEGIAIDYQSQRLYWADSRGGSIYGRIESTTLEGKERELVHEGTHIKPFGLAVDGDTIYWTDINNNGVYRISISKKSEPEKIIEFDGRPMGLVTNNFRINDLSECKYIEAGIKTVKEGEREETAEVSQTEEPETKSCLNDGELVDNKCLCKRGFNGTYCETSICHNFCVNGACRISYLGKLTCRCDAGFVGGRCERNKCDDFCLNGGECTIVSPRDRPQCRCPNGFMGDRCEYSTEICDVYCTDRGDDLFSEKFELLCRCSEGFNVFSDRNRTAARLSASKEQDNFFSSLSNPLYYLAALVLICLLIIITLAVYIRIIRKRRPRIKKRIIVNKNVTPLTYRPQPNTEQCEITIENCCNMNVCETPCYEPRSFQEDKKTLLSNMEGEDF
ncbi:protein cueball [Anoplophora glabripennis]|uniref:protein cueball n=1 Tax=Anoplophora glabripennis TaxID=217634 RepID=UPI000873900F|nr:protein cueball [Anoplophora glabripennis]